MLTLHSSPIFVDVSTSSGLSLHSSDTSTCIMSENAVVLTLILRPSSLLLLPLQQYFLQLHLTGSQMVRRQHLIQFKQHVGQSFSHIISENNSSSDTIYYKCKRDVYLAIHIAYEKRCQHAVFSYHAYSITFRMANAFR